MAEKLEGLSAADSRQVRMAVAAWLDGRRDAEFWLKHIHVTLGSPTSEALKQSARIHPPKGDEGCK